MRNATQSLKMKLTGRDEERKQPMRDNYTRPERDQASPLRKMVENANRGPDRFSVDQQRVENSNRSKSPIQPYGSNKVDERYLQPETVNRSENPSFRLSTVKV